MAVVSVVLKEIHFSEEDQPSIWWLNCLLTFPRLGCDQAFTSGDVVVADRYLTFFSGETPK